MQNTTLLYRHLHELSRYYVIRIDSGYRFVLVEKMRLPPGYNRKSTSVLIVFSPDYPLSPPGVGRSRVYIDSGLLYYGRILKEYHNQAQLMYHTPGFGPWSWICYERIQWNPLRDNLVRFLEMLRADLTHPL